MSVPQSPPPPRRHMSPTGRIVIPALLVVLLIVVLGRPILVAGLDLDTEPTDPVPVQQGTPKKEDRPGPSRLAAPYPSRCLAEAPAPGLGLIAASDGTSVTAASPTGTDAFALQARPPVGFSASGTFLATAGADLWRRDGSHVGIAFSRPVEAWAWSPVGDCIAGIENGRLVVAEPGKRAIALIEGIDVSTFAFSPDGTRILFSVTGNARSSGLWLADLRDSDVKILQSSLGWTLMGWSSGMRPVLFRQGLVNDAESKAGLAFPTSDSASSCGEDIVTINGDRISNIGVSDPPRYIPVDRGFRYTAVSCSPGGELMLVVRYKKGDPLNTSMAVLRRDGTFVREVAQQSRLEDGPMWGPAGTGVVFAGDVSGEGAVGPLVWFLPEGGTARPTGLRLDKLGDRLDSFVDWSATPPLGHPSN